MQDMDPGEARELLRASRLGTLALNRGGASYAVPLYFGFDGEHVFFHCHPGLKDEYLEATEEACLVAIHVESPNVWESVQVFGPVERVSLSNEIDAAKSALLHVPFPPLHGNFPGGLPKRSDQEVYHLKLTPDRIVGRKSVFQEGGKPSA